MDLSTAAGLVAALLPEIVLTVIGMIVLLLGAWKHGSARAMKVIGWVTVAGFAVTLLMFATMWRNAVTAEGFTSMIALDPFRYASGILVLLAAVLTTALSIDYLEREQLKLPEYYAMMIFAVLGMLFMTGASDLIVVFVGLELMSVSVYVLAGINRHSLFSAEAALKYFLLGAFASGFLLYGIALIYGATGTTNLTLINFQVGASDLAGSVMLLAGVGMLLIGFAFKVAAVPFHMWAPDVYDGSPTPVTSFMATAVKVAGFAALVRILFHAFGNWTVIWQDAIWWLAAVTMIGGNLMALAQRKLKRMLAYSSIGHAGYILVAVVSGTDLGGGAFLFYLLAYTLMTVGAFAVLAAAGTGGEQDVRIDSFAGLASQRPWVALAMTVFMLSLLGFPGTAGFIGKWSILSSAIDARQSSLAVVLVLASVLSAGFYLPVLMAMYMKSADSEDAHAALKLGSVPRLVVAGTAILLVLFGVWPNRILDAAQDGGRDLRSDTPIVAINH